MKEKRDCKIVQDLLPNYIENLTNEETNSFIEEHLKECNECKDVLENMKKDFKINTEKQDTREVNYIKKYSKKLKILKAILLAILIVYILVVGRRTIIMFSLSEKAKQTQVNDNYYVRLYSYQGDTLTITESYNKGEDYLTTHVLFSNGNEAKKVTFYKKGNEKLFLMESEGKKYTQNPEQLVGGKLAIGSYVPNGLLSSLQYAFLIGIDSTYCNGRKCYIIKGDGYERYIDKETGIVVRSIEKSSKDVARQTDTVVDYEYKFNVVKDSDIVKPDITGSKTLE